MQKTTVRELNVRVGGKDAPIRLADSAVEAVQEEASGRLVTALADTWAIIGDVEQGEGFDSLFRKELLELRRHLRTCGEMVEVLIECRPLSEW